MKNKTKDIILNTILSVSSVVILLIFIEISFRIHYIFLQKDDYIIARFVPEDFWDQYDPMLGWKQIPGKTVLHAYNKIPVTINKQGLRSNKEYDLTRKKILAIGCSFTFGHGVPVENAWPQKLEDTLKSNNFDYDVMNMGACAYGLDQTYLWFSQKENEFKPNIVILALTSTLDRVLNYRWMSGHGKPRFKIIMGHLILTNVPAPRRVLPGKEFLNWQKIFFDFNKSYFLEYALKGLHVKMKWDGKTSEKLQIAEKLLNAINEDCKKNNYKFLVVLIDPDPGVKEILIRNKIYFTECSLKVSKSLRLFPDSHPSSLGYELIAKNIYDYLMNYNQYFELQRDK